MTRTYQVAGMTCSSCQAKVTGVLSAVAGVDTVSIDLSTGQAFVTSGRPIAAALLRSALAGHPRYQLTETATPAPPTVETTGQKSWWATYKPLLLVFFFILLVSGIAAGTPSGFGLATGMRIFMSSFFLVFSFFKLLDLDGFAASYRMYDVITKRWRGWAYVYAFAELALGICYAINFRPVVVNAVTVLLLSVSLIGVLQAVVNKREIRCACLGTGFNLPMTTVTIVEDVLMITMALAALVLH